MDTGPLPSEYAASAPADVTPDFLQVIAFAVPELGSTVYLVLGLVAPMPTLPPNGCMIMLPTLPSYPVAV